MSPATIVLPRPMCAGRIPPGAWCAKKQYGQYGYSMRHAAHTKRYKCVRYASGRWHWKAAA